MPSPWLNGKHTIFGKVYRGSEVVTYIESVQVDNYEKPINDIVILNTSVLEYY